MSRHQHALDYLKAVQSLRMSIEHETSKQVREIAVQKFRAEVNPVIDKYMSPVYSIANAFVDLSAAQVERESQADILFRAVNGLARAGKDAAVENLALSLHYLKCTQDLGTLWIKVLSVDS